MGESPIPQWGPTPDAGSHMRETSMNHAGNAESASNQAVAPSGTQPAALITNENPLPQKLLLFAVDDDPVVRKGLRMFLNLQPDMELCGDAGGVSTAKQGIDAAKPELVIVDLGLEEGDGFELIEWIHRHHPHIKILVFSSRDDKASAARAFRCGAHGYVVKSDGTRELTHVIRLILQNRCRHQPRGAKREPPHRAGEES